MGQKTESFNLNTAVSFLPVMDDTEEVTKQLISSIKMYNSLLDEESKPLLLNFIFTSRLSPSAHVRLSKNYKTVEHLVNDMSKFLLTKKSFTVIQQQLSQCTQNQKTIDAYGKEIEKLFVDLTIAQADGDPHKNRILRPVNEKLAIDRFASGLQNNSLRTIILSRNYRSLKEAVQGAKDEQASMSLGNKANEGNKPFPNTMTPSYMGRGHSSQGRGGHNNNPNQGKGRGDTPKNHNQVAPGKSVDNRDGNNHSQRGQHPSSRGCTRGGQHSGNQQNQGASNKNHDNRDGNNHSQRGHQSSRGCPRGGQHSGNQHNQGAASKYHDNRNGNNHSQRGHQSSRGCTRGGQHSQHSGNHNPGAPGKNFDNCDGNNSNRGNSRGNSRGNNQHGSYHNQGNRGGNNNNRGSRNSSGPVPSFNVPGFQVDCQFRFTATAGGVNVNNASSSKNNSAPNKNNQVAKRN